MLKAIEKLKEKVNNVPKLVEEASQNIAQKAQSAAPLGISVQYSNGSVVAKGPLAAYKEFGTGPAAEVLTATLPGNWDKYAMSFYKTGKGTLLDDQYLFPAYESERIELIKRIKDSFKNA